ncbi:MAG: phosphatidylglycerophosphatase A [Desulfobacteraceae bacterium]
MLRESFGKAGFFGKTALVLSAWFGAGLMPIAPGTCGTLLGLPLVLLMNHMGAPYAASFLVLFIFLAVWTSDLTQKMLGGQDPSQVVIDEVAGFLLALFLVPPSWLSLAVGFVLFRILDILKPFPIRRLEKLPGGWGIVLDDLVAGAYTNLCLRFVMFFIGAHPQ